MSRFSILLLATLCYTFGNAYGQTLPSINNVIYVDGVKYTTLQSAIQACVVSSPCVVDGRNPNIGTQTWTTSCPLANMGANSVLLTGPYTVQWDHSAFFCDVPSHFRWVMNGTTILNSTGSTGAGVNQLPGVLPYNTFIGTRIYQTTGSISSSSNSLTVASATNLSVGAMVGVLGAGGSFSKQATTINQSGGIGTGDSSFTVTSTGGWDTTRTNYLKIDNELLSCTGGTVTTFSGCTRGRYGTTAATHANGAAVQAVGVFVSEITAISGTTVTLADNAFSAVTSAPVYSGVTDVTFDGSGTLNGNQTVGAGSTFLMGIAAAYSGNVVVNPGVKIKNFDHGGILATASKFNTFLPGALEGNGKPSSGLGSDVWLFEQASNNVVRTGAHYKGSIALEIDDRSSTFTINSGASSNNTTFLGPIEGPYFNCADVEGFSSNNTVYLGRCKSSSTGILVTGSGQWTTGPTPSNNSIFFGSIDGGVGAAITTTLYTGGNNSIQGGNVIAGTVGAASGDLLNLANASAIRPTHYGQLSTNGDVSGSVALVSGTKTITFAIPYQASPICIAQDATTIANTVQCSTSTTQAVLTGTGTDTVKYIILGNPD